MSSLFEGKLCCIVTGGVRRTGFGCAVALAVASQLQQAQTAGEGSLLILTYNSADHAAETRKRVLEACPKLSVRTVQADLRDVTNLSKSCDNVLCASADAFDSVLLINNAGSLGDISKSTKEQTDPSVVHDYFASNLTSFIVFSARFLQHFSSCKTRALVNISSLLAVQPFDGFSLYAGAKSARDMILRVMALEEEKSGLRVLNYAPGPMGTDILEQVMCKARDESVRTTYSTMKAEDKLVKCEESAAKLVRLLQEDKYENAQHIDFYDDV